MVSIKQLALLALTTGLATVTADDTGNVNKPIQSCDKSDNPLTSFAAKNSCESGGSAFMCTNQSPWAINDSLAYGFAAVKLAGKTESNWCCACYE
jgi:hypothetical protein